MHYDRYEYESTLCHMCETMWTVTAQELTEINSSMGVWHGSKQIPTFYVQATSKEQALRKAAEILKSSSKNQFVVDVVKLSD